LSNVMVAIPGIEPESQP